MDKMQFPLNAIPIVQKCIIQLKLYVKGYGFLSFARNIGKNLSNKYSQKLVDTAKKSATDTLKTASNWESSRQ